MKTVDREIYVGRVIIIAGCFMKRCLCKEAEYTKKSAADGDRTKISKSSQLLAMIA